MLLRPWRATSRSKFSQRTSTARCGPLTAAERPPSDPLGGVRVEHAPQFRRGATGGRRQLTGDCWPAAFFAGGLGSCSRPRAETRRGDGLGAAERARLCAPAPPPAPPSFAAPQVAPALNRSIPSPPPLSAASDACGISGMLLVPQAFGNIYLGETLRCYVSLANFSERNVTTVSIKARSTAPPLGAAPHTSPRHLPRASSSSPPTHTRRTAPAAG